MKGKMRLMNLLLAIVMTLALALPLTALTVVTSSTPAEANGTNQVPPYLSTSKTAGPAGSATEVWVSGSGGGNELAEITLTVEGQGDAPPVRLNEVDLVFALDSSGSMSWNDPSDLRLSGAKSFVDKLDSTLDRAGLVDWDSYIEQSVALTDDFTSLKSDIDNVNSSGGTRIYTGLREAISILDTGKRTDSTGVIIFLTDGYGTYYHSDAETAAANGYVIYSIGLTGSDPVNTWPLTDMADTTGGQYFESPTADNLDDIYDAIFSTSVYPAGTDITVTEVLPSHITYIGSPTQTLATGPTTDPTTGETTLTWDIANLSTTDTWTVTFQVKSTQAGSAVTTDVVPDSRIEYTDWQSRTIVKPFPQATMEVLTNAALQIDKTIASTGETDIWVKRLNTTDGFTPYKTRLKLEVDATGTHNNIEVIDVLQSYVNYEGNPTYSTSKTLTEGTDSSGRTTLSWDVDTLTDDTWWVEFDVSSNMAGKDLPLNVLVDSKVTYGTSDSAEFPQTFVDVYSLLEANKYASPNEIWKVGEGTPDESTVTLSVMGPGDDVVVTDVLQSHINYLGNPTVIPDILKSGKVTSGTATSLTVTGADFVTDGITAGMRITNSTDNSSGVITAVSAETLTFAGGISGGTANAFATNDNYYVSDAIVNSDGTTTITWTVGDLGIGEYWDVSFDVSSSLSGQSVPIDVVANNVSKVTYDDWEATAREALFPEGELLVKTLLTVDKSISDSNIWLIEKGDPDTTTVTLTVTGPADDIVVTEALPDYLKVVAGTLTQTPDTDYPYIDDDGDTIIQWTVGSLGVVNGVIETWQVSFDVSSTMLGIDLPVDVLAKSEVSYTDWGESPSTESFPQAYVSVYAPLEVDKTATPLDLWKKGVGTPYKSTVTLTVVGPGTNIVVTEILPSDITLEGEVTVTPDGGATTTSTKTMVWTVGELGEGEEWTVSYDVSSSTAGNKVALQTSAGTVAAYTAWAGVTPTAIFPKVFVSVKAPLEVEVNLAPVFFAGLTAEAYILTTIGGEALDAEIDSVIIYYNNGQEYVDLTSTIENVPDAEGLFRVAYDIPSGADMGGYKMVVTASSAGLHGTSSGIFQVLTVPLEIMGYPIWIWGIAVVVILFILMMIAVRIATMGRH